MSRALSRRFAFLLLPVVVILAAATINHGRAHVTEASEPSPAEQLAGALSSNVNLNFIEMPLLDVARILEEKHGIQVLLDEKALTDANVALDTPINFRIQGISLRSALRLLLRDLDLKMIPKEDLLWITTKDIHDDYCEPRVHEVLDIAVSPGADPSSFWQYDFDSLIDLVQNGIRPDVWNTHGGSGAIEKLPNAGAIMACVNPEIQDHIAQLLAMLRRSREQQFAGGNLKPLAQRSLASIKTHATAAPAIRKAIAERINLRCDGDPLDAVLDKLFEQVKVPVCLDVKALNDANIALDEPVTIKLKACRLSDALEIVLRPKDLHWTIVDEVVLITTKDMANDTMTARVYPASDFIEAEWRLGPTVAANPLKYALLHAIDPTSWTPNGGAGTMEYHPQSKSLVVVHTEQVHQEIERMLVSLRQARLRQLPPQPVDPPADVNDDTLHVKVYWIPSSLSVQPSFGGFSGVLGIGGMSGMFSVADPQAGRNDPVVAAEGGISGGPQTVVAQIQVPTIKPSIPPYPGLTSELARIIPLVIEPESWKDAGGNGVMEHVQNRLVIRQTNRVHAQIAKLLREL